MCLSGDKFIDKEEYSSVMTIYGVPKKDGEKAFEKFAVVSFFLSLRLALLYPSFLGRQRQAYRQSGLWSIRQTLERVFHIQGQERAWQLPLRPLVIAPDVSRSVVGGVQSTEALECLSGFLAACFSFMFDL